MSTLTARREAAGLGQRQVALALGVRQPTLSRWETGRTPVRVDTLHRLAVIYRCSPSELI